MNNTKGFSLLELLVVMAIFGIVAAIGISNFPEVSASVERANGRQQFEFDIRRARVEATREGAIAVIEVSPGEDSYTVGLDYTPFNAPPSADLVLFSRVLDPSITLSVSDTIYFNTRGYLTDAAGDLSTIDFSLSHHGAEYASATVFPIGMIDYAE